MADVRTDSHLQSAAKSASYNIALQVLFRLSTFVVNAILIRQISGETHGVVNVRLVLLYTTILFVSREAYRKACLSFDQVDSKDKVAAWIGIVNLAWLSVPTGIVTAIFFCFVWTNFLVVPSDPAQYGIAVIVYGLSAVFTLTVEPLWIVAQLNLIVKLKVIAEGIALGVQAFVAVSLVFLYPATTLFPFCVAQICHTVATVAVYYGYMAVFVVGKDDDFPIRTMGQFLPQTENFFGTLPIAIRDRAKAFLVQGVLKQLLTEGEKFLMTITGALSFTEQGVYDTVNNLGSLVARFLFMPIEESYFTFFAGHLSHDKALRTTAKDDVAASTLQTLLKFVTLIGLIIFTFGQGYSKLLLTLYGGTKLADTSAPVLLEAYAAYVVVLAVNGMTECFASAAMNETQVKRHNQWMLLFSVIFVGAAAIFTSFLGSVGFILANAVNMLVRIIKSCYTISTYFEGSENPLWGALPDKYVVLAFFISVFITEYAERTLCCKNGWMAIILHVGIGAGCLVMCLATIYLLERDFVTAITSMFKGRTARQEEVAKPKTQ